MAVVSSSVRFIIINIINYKILQTFACTSGSHFKYYRSFNIVNENSSLDFLPLGKQALEELNTFPQDVDEEKLVQRKLDPVQTSALIQDIYGNDTKALLTSPMKLLTSLTKVLNVVATTIFPKMNISWIFDSPMCERDDNLTLNYSSSDKSDLCSLLLSDENTTSTEIVNEEHLEENPENTTTSMNSDSAENITKTLLIPIFSMLKPQEKPCYFGDDSLGEGMCFSKSKCSRMGGQEFGHCNGGICCVFSKSCGDTTRDRRAIFESPFYPKPFFPAQVQSEEVDKNNQKPFMCRLKIEKIKTSICQIHLHFTRFEIRGVDGAVCRRDIFIATGINNQIPPLCGNNTAQHMYLDVDRTKQEVELQFIIDSNVVEGRKWNIQIQQINCNENGLVPSGCLQYHRNKSGVIRSFNYGDATTKETAGYPPGLNYAICIQKSLDSCSIRFEPRGPFQIDVSTTHPGRLPMDFVCRNDYLLIPNSHSLMGNSRATFDRFCGSGFPPLLRSRSGPYVLQFVSDYAGFRDGGFQLQYEQESC